MNSIRIIGRLTQEPKFSVTPNENKEMAKFDVAVTRTFNKDVADYFHCVVFGNTVTKFIKPYIHKGDKIFVEGEFQINRYSVKDSEEKRSYSQIVVKEIQIVNPYSKNENKNSVPEEAQEISKDETATQISDEESLPF